MDSVKAIPVHPPVDKSLEGRIRGGSPGPSTIHKVGSAKQYAVKSTGRVCNQAKFPSGKSAARKRD